MFMESQPGAGLRSDTGKIDSVLSSSASPDKPHPKQFGKWVRSYRKNGPFDDAALAATRSTNLSKGRVKEYMFDVHLLCVVLLLRAKEVKVTNTHIILLAKKHVISNYFWIRYFILVDGDTCFDLHFQPPTHNSSISCLERFKVDYIFVIIFSVLFLIKNRKCTIEFKIVLSNFSCV